jgi:hypothetical protein
MNKILMAAFAALILMGCTASDPGLAQVAVDEALPVAEEHRPLRICLISAMSVELMVDRVRLFEPSKAEETLGRLLTLQGAMEDARMADPMWRNTDMADVLFTFSSVVTDTVRERARGYLSRGLSAGSVITGAKRVSAQKVKAHAMLRDIGIMMDSMVAGKVTESELWLACESRVAHNERRIRNLLGL